MNHRQPSYCYKRESTHYHIHREPTSKRAWSDPLVKKSANVQQMYGLNINGLKLDQLGGQLDELCQIINKVQAKNVFCGQEHSLDSDNTQFDRFFIKQPANIGNVHESLLGPRPFSKSKQHEPGGTFLITANDLTGRVIAQKQDKWGRWVSQVYQGRGSIKIVVACLG